MAKYVMALDSGTTSNRCILFNERVRCAVWLKKSLHSISPNPAGLNTMPMKSGSSQLGVAVEAMSKIGAVAEDIAAIGITNQRETTIVWDKATGEPVISCNRMAVQTYF